MGVLLITCPTTGKDFSTGLQVEEREVPTLPDYGHPLPLLQKLHRWRPADAKWVEALLPPDWIENR
jgi:hypothetical protein